MQLVEQQQELLGNNTTDGVMMSLLPVVFAVC